MEIQKGGDIGILMADSCCCMAEPNTTFKSNYPQIKNFFFKSKKFLLGLPWLSSG